MIATRLIGRGIIVVAAVGVLALAVGAGSAYAEALAPWWNVTSGAQPTNLQPGIAKDAVQRLTIEATKGDVFLAEPRRLTQEPERELLYAVVPYNASAELMQKELERIYPTKKVLVTGGPGDEGGTKPYVITFPGQLVQEPLFASGFLASLFGGEPLSGGAQEAKVTVLSEGETDGQIVVTAYNLGDGAANGATTPVSIVDKLPPGLEAVGIEAYSGESASANDGPVECSLGSLTCTFAGSLPAADQIEVHIFVEVQPGASSGEENTARVSGGGAGSKTDSHPIEVNGRTRFGFDEYQVIPENVGGSIDTQAGSHPFQVTSIFTLNTQRPDQEGRPRLVALPKDISGELPKGLIGNPTPFAQCTDAQFAKNSGIAPTNGNKVNECPPQSAIGMATVTFNEPGAVYLNNVTVPLFNMKPRVGEPARFGFEPIGLIPVFLDASVRTGRDYGVTLSSNNILQIAWLLGVRLTFWGVPGDSRHDLERGWECLYKYGTCTPSTGVAPPPFLIMPTSCDQPFQTTLQGDSWGASEKPSEQAEPLTYRLPEAMDGCDHLNFAPSISVSPDTPSGSTPTGLTVGVHVPQSSSLNPEGLAESTVKETTVALPEGVGLNPASGDGLEACSEAQIGFEGVEAGDGADLFTPGLPEPFCPDAAKVATVKIKTPLLPNPLEGEVYLASPAPLQEAGRNPFGSLVALYIVAQDPVSGTLVKLPGEVKLDPVTGRLVATFKNTPELPFEDLELHFFGGSRAPLGSPGLCGPYTTTTSIAPWSGNPPATPSSTFEITTGPNGSPCTNPLPFDPSLTAGSTNIQTGAFSLFTMTMSREDGNQNLKAVRLKMPPGLLGTLASVKLCGEAEANAGTCGPESLIGETIVSVGLGSTPFSVKGGRVYITGPYKGAPFGLSIVNPAKAGPFDLGEVIVRAKIEVDPITAALTVTTDDSGPYAIPQILDGIPLQIKHINVSIDRPDFTFNPTNCSPTAITGSLTSSQGATDALSVPFQVTNCATLAFKPLFRVSTAGRTSRAKGASLDVKLSYPKAPWGTQANIRSVKVDLPKQLPSRLTTLQKACTDSTFNRNPAACPAASRIGTATATTPIIPVGLSGPAYFVSHGGAKFPELVIVLSGYGVTVQLHGETFISPAGITSSTFRTIPDVPIGSFELKLPQGPGSALAANGNLCKSTLRMPTTFTAQNGLVIHQSTRITPTGCAKHKQARKAGKHRGGSRHRKKK